MNSEWKLKLRKVILLINFISYRTFFLVASSQFFNNDTILINHGSFFRGKIQRNWFIFKNWKRSSYRKSFPRKNVPWFIRLASFLKICFEAIRKKVRAKIQFISKIVFLCFKFFSCKIIFSLLNNPFNNIIVIPEIKTIYFCLRPNFRECTTLITYIHGEK